MIFDGTIGKRFGKIIRDVKKVYHRGDTAVAVFVGANPRNNLRLEGTFLQVLYRPTSTDSWQVYATDADWSTKFIWKRKSVIFGTSRVTIKWEIPEDAPLGEYKLVYLGDAKPIIKIYGFIKFTGESSTFHLV